MGTHSTCPTCGQSIAALDALEPLTKTARLVLEEYRAQSRAGDGIVRLGCKDLGRRVGRTESSARAARRVLERRGYLLRVERGGGDGAAAFTVAPEWADDGEASPAAAPTLPLSLVESSPPASEGHWPDPAA